MTIVGYGRTGVGATGDQGAASGSTKRMGQNTIDTLATTLPPGRGSSSSPGRATSD
ncbi:MAG: hypothetical protein U0797_29150 [Gemmataceae bacterium]